jgi:hypothetical protein
MGGRDLPVGRDMEKQRRDEGTAKKRPYATPKLVRYGEVRRLTQGGTTGANEVANMGLMTRMASDRALKQNIVRIGTHPVGIGLYLYDYKAAFRDRLGHGRQFGVMADEVEAVLPDAVCVGDDGYQRVDYARLGIVVAGGSG